MYTIITPDEAVPRRRYVWGSYRHVFHTYTLHLITYYIFGFKEGLVILCCICRQVLVVLGFDILQPSLYLRPFWARVCGSPFGFFPVIDCLYMYLSIPTSFLSVYCVYYCTLCYSTKFICYKQVTMPKYSLSWLVCGTCIKCFQFCVSCTVWNKDYIHFVIPQHVFLWACYCHVSFVVQS